MSLSLKYSNITSYNIRVDLKQTRVTLWCLIEDQANFEICNLYTESSITIVKEMT